jgi:hypothetical protein
MYVIAFVVVVLSVTRRRSHGIEVGLFALISPSLAPLYVCPSMVHCGPVACVPTALPLRSNSFASTPVEIHFRQPSACRGVRKR